MKQPPGLGCWDTTRGSGAMTGLFCHHSVLLPLTPDNMRKVPVPKKDFSGVDSVKVVIVEDLEDAEQHIIPDGKYQHLMELAKACMHLAVNDLSVQLSNLQGYTTSTSDAMNFLEQGAHEFMTEGEPRKVVEACLAELDLLSSDPQLHKLQLSIDKWVAAAKLQVASDLSGCMQQPINFFISELGFDIVIDADPCHAYPSTRTGSCLMPQMIIKDVFNLMFNDTAISNFIQTQERHLQNAEICKKLFPQMGRAITRVGLDFSGSSFLH